MYCMLLAVGMSTERYNNPDKVLINDCVYLCRPIWQLVVKVRVYIPWCI